ncbi:MAG: hypothetical protein LBC73_05655 [Oscillospiraceae bacterium]|jgi:hypothetical protein|nr:hypothetical protein [Oscillospiraceae bacterium]
MPFIEWLKSNTYSFSFTDATNKDNNDSKQFHVSGSVIVYRKRGDLFDNIEHRYFFVEKFYDTDFKKESKGALRGNKIFDLCEVLELNELPDTKKIAEMLRKKKWY